MSWIKKNQGDLLVFSPNQPEISDENMLSSSVEDGENPNLENESIDFDEERIIDSHEIDLSSSPKNDEGIILKESVEGEELKFDEVNFDHFLSDIDSKLNEFIKHCRVSKDKNLISDLMDLLQKKTEKLERLNRRLRKKKGTSKSSPSTPKRKTRRLASSNNKSNSLRRTPPNSPSRIKNYKKNISSTPSPKRSRRRRQLEVPDDDPNRRRHSSPSISPTTSPKGKSSPRTRSGGRRRIGSPSSRNRRNNSGTIDRVLSFDSVPSRLHEKLSSPDRRPNLTPHDIKRKIRTKQENASRRRREMNDKRKELYRRSKEKIKKVKQKREKIRSSKIKVTEQRHKKAEKKHQEILGRRVENARETGTKVREVKYVVSMLEKIEKKEKRSRIEKKHFDGMIRKREKIKIKVEAAKKLNEKENIVKANRERLMKERREKRKSRELRSERNEKRIKEHKQKEMIKRKKKLEEHNKKVEETKQKKAQKRELAKERIMKKIREVSERKKESIQSIKKKAERALEKVRKAKRRSGGGSSGGNFSPINNNNNDNNNNEKKIIERIKGGKKKNKKKKKRSRPRSHSMDSCSSSCSSSSSSHHHHHHHHNQKTDFYRVPSKIFQDRLRKSKEELFKFKKKYFSLSDFRNNNFNNSNSSSSSTTIINKSSDFKIKEKKLREIMQHMNSLLSAKKTVPNSMVSNVTRNLRKLVNYDTKQLIENKKVLSNLFRFYRHLDPNTRSKTTMVQFFLYTVKECKISNFLMRSLMINKFFEITVQALDVGDINDAVLLICLLITCLSDEFHILKTDNDVQIKFARIITQVVASYGLIHQVVQLIRDYACSGGWPGGRISEGWTGLDMSTHIPDYIHNAFYFVREVCREQFFHVMDFPVSVVDGVGGRIRDDQNKNNAKKINNKKKKKHEKEEQQEEEKVVAKPFVVNVFQTVVCPELTQFLATLILSQGPIRKGLSNSLDDEGDDITMMIGNDSSSSSSKINSSILKIDISDSLIDLTSIILESLNHLARYDIRFVQKFLWDSFEFRHLVHTLLAYTTTYCEERPSEANKYTQLKNNIYGILNQVILLLGYFSCMNSENQNLLHLRSSNVTIVKQLCNLPLQYFSDDEVYKHVIIPTLICCVYQNKTNTSILSEEIDTIIISDYVEEYQKMSILSLPRFLKKRPEYKLENRFPMGEIENLISFLDEC